MSNWIDAYLSAIELRDSREKANEDVINAYTKLADHTASLYKTAFTKPISPSISPPTKQPVPVPILAFPKGQTTEPSDIPSLRADLLSAQRSRTTLTSEVASLRAELSALTEQAETSKSQLGTLHGQKAILERRLRDRDSELKEKRKMLEQVQDEIVGLEMQVNVAEGDRDRFKAENEQLVRRLVGLARENQRGWDGRVEEGH